MIGGSTPSIDTQIMIHQSLGTRELIYRTQGSLEKKKLLKKITFNEKNENEMRMELRTSVQGFLLNHQYNENYEIDPDIETQIFNYSSYLSVMRVQADIDWQSGEVNGEVIPEEPTRIFKQLKRMYISLMSLDKGCIILPLTFLQTLQSFALSLRFLHGGECLECIQ